MKIRTYRWLCVLIVPLALGSRLFGASRSRGWESTDAQFNLKPLKVEVTRLPDQKTSDQRHPVRKVQRFVVKFQGGVLPKMSQLGDFSETDLELLEAWVRPTPTAPWVKVPDVSQVNPGFDGDDGDGESNEAGQYNRLTWNGSFYQFTGAISPRRHFEWKLRIKAKVSGMIQGHLNEDHFLNINLRGEQVFEVTTPPVQPDVDYPVEMHPAWVAGVEYAGSQQGPWKQLPTKGQPGFPFRWYQDHRLFLRTAKKFPREPWPIRDNPFPRVTDASNGDYDGSRVAADTVVLDPSRARKISSSGTLWSVHSELGNAVVRQFMILPGHGAPADGVKDTSDLKLAVTAMLVGKGIIYNSSAAASPNQTLEFSPGEPLKFIIRPKAYRKINRVDTEDLRGILARLRLFDATGTQLSTASKLIPDNGDPEDFGDFQISPPKPGKYTAWLDLLDKNNQPIKTTAGPAKTVITITNQAPLSPPLPGNRGNAVPDNAFHIDYGIWYQGTTTYNSPIWSREILVVPVNSAYSKYLPGVRVNLKIDPPKPYVNDPKVSWLSAKTGTLQDAVHPVRFGQLSTGVMQYYRADPTTLPPNASRQMDIYRVTLQKVKSSGTGTSGMVR